jgi:hypothetical protein
MLFIENIFTIRMIWMFWTVYYNRMNCGQTNIQQDNYIQTSRFDLWRPFHTLKLSFQHVYQVTGRFSKLNWEKIEKIQSSAQWTARVQREKYFSTSNFRFSSCFSWRLTTTGLLWYEYWHVNSKVSDCLFLILSHKLPQSLSHQNRLLISSTHVKNMSMTFRQTKTHSQSCFYKISGHGLSLNNIHMFNLNYSFLLFNVLSEYSKYQLHIVVLR